MDVGSTRGPVDPRARAASDEGARSRPDYVRRASAGAARRPRRRHGCARRFRVAAATARATASASGGGTAFPICRYFALGVPANSIAEREALQLSRLFNRDPPEVLRDALQRLAACEKPAVIAHNPRLLSRIELELVEDRRRVTAHRRRKRWRRAVETQRSAIAVEQQTALERPTGAELDVSPA